MKSRTYEEFIDKFKPKLTTDDCCTPPEIYEVIKDYTRKRYGLEGVDIVRPFWPGGDYESFDYPESCVVIDNPPFSILSKIISWYLEKGIKFFLFAPSLTTISSSSWNKANHIMCNATIVYENGATINTSFITNLDGDDVIAETGCELKKIIDSTSDRLRKEKVKSLPKYIYPDHVLTASMMNRYAKYGIDFKIRKGDAVQISQLDSQKMDRKTIFGNGLLLSEKAAAEKAAATRWSLSERELAIVKSLGHDSTILRR